MRVSFSRRPHIMHGTQQQQRRPGDVLWYYAVWFVRTICTHKTPVLCWTSILSGEPISCKQAYIDRRGSPWPMQLYYIGHCIVSVTSKLCNCLNMICLSPPSHHSLLVRRRCIAQVRSLIFIHVALFHLVLLLLLLLVPPSTIAPAWWFWSTNPSQWLCLLFATRAEVIWFGRRSIDWPTVVSFRWHFYWVIWWWTDTVRDAHSAGQPISV